LKELPPLELPELETPPEIPLTLKPFAILELPPLNKLLEEPPLNEPPLLEPPALKLEYKEPPLFVDPIEELNKLPLGILELVYLT
jgi:hypothetical protein